MEVMIFLSALPLWVSLVFMLIGLLTAANLSELQRTDVGRVGAGVGIIAGIVGIILGIIQIGIYFDFWPVTVWTRIGRDV